MGLDPIVLGGRIWIRSEPDLICNVDSNYAYTSLKSLLATTYG
jgi:hypothetical protein